MRVVNGYSATAENTLTHAERQAAYRQRQGDAGRVKDAARKRKTRAATVTEFIGVDSEGIGRGDRHRAVLLGVGDQHYIARDLDRGLHWTEVFEFLYSQCRLHPHASWVGFYLSYDFNQWLRSLPLNAAWLLLSKEGRALRKMKHDRSTVYRREYHPVRVDGWEIDMMGDKRLSIRPRPQGCNCFESKIKCEHSYEPWMHICDAGSFFQMSFLAVLDPKKWKDDPSGPICTPEEYDRIKRNKAKRSTFARITQEMIFYNELENKLLAVCMDRLAKGFNDVGIRLGKDQWYGPGASASKWLGKHSAPKRTKLTRKEGKTKPLMPKWFWEACQKSYFGGWFEIFSHGLIYGESYNYDINNAYPYATTKLPHICTSCEYRQGKGNYTGESPYVLLYATVYTKSTRIGAVPYRDKEGNILRPGVSKGWYWRHEIEAARRAELVSKVVTHEWVAFVPCSHDKPFTEVRDLYNKRLQVGKDSAQGMAIKLNNNSLYGKFAQAVGAAPFNNWFYASYITSHCRTQILDAIASHPGKANSVLMVATDGICFDSIHPSLPVSKALGEWAETIYHDLVLFKPGVYWHREGKENLVKVKSRGVPREAFAKEIAKVEHQFDDWHSEQTFPGKEIATWAFQVGADLAYFRTEHGWPVIWVPVSFRMKSCKQALNEGHWNSAGTVQEEILLKQDSDPAIKRRRPTWNPDKQRLDTYIHDLPIKDIETRYHLSVKRQKSASIGIGLEGDAMMPLVEMVAAIRDKAPNYDIEWEWENVYGG